MPGRSTYLAYSRTRPTVLAVGAGRVFGYFSPSLWETVRYRLNICLKEP